VIYRIDYSRHLFRGQFAYLSLQFFEREVITTIFSNLNEALWVGYALNFAFNASSCCIALKNWAFSCAMTVHLPYRFNLNAVLIRW